MVLETEKQLQLQATNPGWQSTSYLCSYSAARFISLLTFFRCKSLHCINCQACPRECHSYGNPIGNVAWDGTGINCYGMGIGQINMSHGRAGLTIGQTGQMPGASRLNTKTFLYWFFMFQAVHHASKL